jgi:hypothetical protein
LISQRPPTFAEEGSFAKVIRFAARGASSRIYCRSRAAAIYAAIDAAAIKELKVKKYLSLFWPVAVVLILSVGLSAKDLDTKGKAWLDAHSEAAAVNVNGNWHEKDWGAVVLLQAEGSRDVTGDGDGWAITGVVSGKQIFLLFSQKGSVAYTAELTWESDKSLNGSYAKGFMEEKKKNRPMHLIKP